MHSCLQIAEIKRKAELLKSEINVYLHQSVSQAEMFSNSLMIKKDLLDELWKASQNLVSLCNGNVILSW